ncbi:MAG: polysaccharide export protein [Caulobacteraceae bacterium]|nr:polysaccharide export protein [Caulobacteraceae bacterium]
MKHLVRTFAALLVMGMTACQSAEIPAGPSSPSPAAASITTTYRLGTGDRIRLIVFGEDKLGGEFSISDNGKLSLPLIGDIVASGLTLNELTDKITLALKDGYLRDPRVSVDVLNYRPFYILGEVNKAGDYPYSSGLTVRNAVALAEGFTYRADTKHVFIKHANEVQEHVYSLTTTTPVAPGDTVRIGERHF